MKFTTSILALLGASLLVPAAWASQNIDLSGLTKPGKWQSTVNMTVMGHNKTETTTHCVTANQIKDFKRYKLQQQINKTGAKATIKEVSLEGNRLHMVMQMGQNGTVDTATVFDDPTHSHSTSTVNVQGMKIVSHSKSHRVGECTK